MQTATMIKPKLAFVGVGWIGRSRLQAAAQSGLIDIESISDPSNECLEEAAKIATAKKSLHTFEETINDPNIDAVVIATPSALHMSQAIQAFQNKLSVFCQKPLGRNAFEVRSVLNAAYEADRLLGADFSYRYTTAFTKIKEVISSGELGDIFGVELKFHNAYGPGKAWFYDIQQAGGGCVLDLGVHMIDMMLVALGFPQVTKVSSNLYSRGKQISGGADVEDYAVATMELETGAHAHLSCSWNLQAGTEAIIEASFYGTNGGVGLKNINGSFYDFAAYRYYGTKTEILASPPDDWGGRAIIDWINKLCVSSNFQADSQNYLASAIIIDRIYNNAR